MAKAQVVGGDMVWFWCPGCDRKHWVNIDPEDQPLWAWNGSVTAPSFSPSVLIGTPRCHSFVTDGRIAFLSDCDHKLAGKTVELPEMED